MLGSLSPSRLVGSKVKEISLRIFFEGLNDDPIFSMTLDCQSCPSGGRSWKKLSRSSERLDVSGRARN